MPRRDAQINPGRSSRYHFESLPADLKRLYVPIRNAVIEGRTEVVLDSSFSFEDCVKAIESVLMDNPQAFWVRFPATMESRGGASSIRISKTGFHGKREELKERLWKAAEDIYAKEVEGLKDPYDIEAAVHDVIASKVRYDKSDPATAHSLIGPLLKKRGVCDGISSSVAFLLNAYGVESSVVTGTKKGNGESHAWNVVKIGKEWYHADVTFDMGCSEEGRVSHAFLNMDDRMASRTHGFFPSGRCKATRFNYYVRRGAYLRSESEAETYLLRRPSKEDVFDFYVEGPADAKKLMAMAASSRQGTSIRCKHTDGRFVIHVVEGGGINADFGTPQEVRDDVRLP